MLPQPAACLATLPSQMPSNAALEHEGQSGPQRPRQTQAFAGAGGGLGATDPMKEIIVLAACGANEVLPQVRACVCCVCAVHMSVCGGGCYVHA